VPVNVFAKVRGEFPDAIIGPAGVPECIVMNPPPENVNCKVVPDTAPEIVEYSPAKEQVEIVVNTLLVGIVAEPNDEAKVQPLAAIGQFKHCTVVVWQLKSVPQDEFNAQ
jgi:hypothetical protein